MSRIRPAVLMLLIAMGVGLWNARPSAAQLIVVTQKLYVSEVRPDHYKIGISPHPGVKTRSWVKVDGRTRVYRRLGRRLVRISHYELWHTLHRGDHIKVHGGADWDLNIVARQIWIED